MWKPTVVTSQIALEESQELELQVPPGQVDTPNLEVDKSGQDVKVTDVTGTTK